MVKMATKVWSLFQGCLQPELFLSIVSSALQWNCLKRTDAIRGDVY